MVRDERLSEPDAERAAQAAREACSRPVADVEPISKGINAIYRIEFADGERAVLKAATFNTAAELRAEPRILSRLDRETELPVPEVLAVAEDGGSLGVFHFLLDYCEGRQIRDLDRLSPDEQERLVQDAGRNLARLHEYQLDEVEGCGPLRMTDPEEDGNGREFTTGPDRDSWGDVFASLADHPIQLVEQVECGDDSGRFSDLVPDVVAAFEEVEEAVAEAETPVVLHLDFRPDNFVLTPPDQKCRDDSADERPIRYVLDFGDPAIGDYRLDLAFAEDATIRVAMPGTERADYLAELLRTAYARERGIDHGEIRNDSYPYYLLVQRARWMAVAMQWDEYDDPEEVERAYRSFVREQLAEIR
jgi:aminoglycoside phosphotransferase (APT) family kinase protein